MEFTFQTPNIIPWAWKWRAIRAVECKICLSCWTILKKKGKVKIKESEELPQPVLDVYRSIGFETQTDLTHQDMENLMTKYSS